MVDDLTREMERTLGGFPEPDMERWLAAVGKLVQGGVVRSERTGHDGTEARSLYRPGETDLADELPGHAPFTRGARPVTVARAWRIRQSVRHPDPGTAGRQISEELAAGADEVLVRLDGAAPHAASGKSGKPPDGVVAYDLDDFERLFGDDPRDTGRVAFEPGGDFTSLAALLIAFRTRHGLGIQDLDIMLGVDPLGAAASGVPIEPGAALARAVGMTLWCEAQGTPAIVFRADGHPYHAGGASAGQELGATLATATAYLRDLDRAGLPIDCARKRIGFRVAVDTDVFVSIAKVRALRKLWGRVCESCGADARGTVIEAITANRMMASREVHLNLLRTTAAAFAGAVAGVDALTVLPLDDALGLPSPEARGLARNVQLILQHETGVERVVDPLGGSAYLEALTQDLARQAWSVFQLIEAGNGMPAMLHGGSVGEWVAATWSKREKNIAKRLDPITGVSMFPFLHEKRVAPVTHPQSTEVPDGKRARARDVRDLDFAEIVALASSGHALVVREASGSCTPVVAHRFDEGFEALRARSDAILARSGRRPRALLLELGYPAQTAERAGFARNVFAAGGIELVESGPVTDLEAATAAVRNHGLPLTVMTASDQIDDDRLISLVRTICSSGTTRLWLTGRPAELPDALTENGLERCIDEGDDLIELLTEAYRALGEAP